MFDYCRFFFGCDVTFKTYKKKIGLSTVIYPQTAIIKQAIFEVLSVTLVTAHVKKQYKMGKWKILFKN